MLQRIITGAAGTVVALCATLAAAAPPALLLEGGLIHTGNPAQPRAQAVLAVGPLIGYGGDAATARERAPEGTRIVDLEGGTVMPGLTDSHAHLADIGSRELGFDLTGVESLAALQRRLAERVASDASPWIVGANWIESKWQPAVFPTRADLDAIVRDRPVILGRVDGHAAVVNTRALEIAGITRDTPDPPGGQILRDPATGDGVMGIKVYRAGNIDVWLTPHATDPRRG